MSFIYLPKLPRDTEVITFGSAFKIAAPIEEVAIYQLLDTITQTRQQVCKSLNQFEGTLSDRDGLMNSYLALASGFLRSSSTANQPRASKDSTSSQTPLTSSKDAAAATTTVPLSRGVCGPWSNFSRQKNKMGHGDVQFDMFNVLLGYGLWLLQYTGRSLLTLKSQDSRVLSKEVEGLTLHCARAAGVFALLRSSVSAAIGSGSSPEYLLDFDDNTLEALRLIALAEGEGIMIEGWERVWLKTEEGRTGDDLTRSILCNDIFTKFESAKKALSTTQRKQPKANAKWLAYLEFKKVYFLAKAQYYQGLHFLEGQSPSGGKAVKTMDTAFNSAMDACSLFTRFVNTSPKSPDLQDRLPVLEDWKNTVENGLKKAIRDNNFIYYEKVPFDAEPLPAPKETLQVIESGLKYGTPKFEVDERWTPNVYQVLHAKEDAVAKRRKQGLFSCCN